MVNTQGFNPTTGEWNDTLTGDFIWTNTNIGRGVISQYRWCVLCV